MYGISSSFQAGHRIEYSRGWYLNEIVGFSGIVDRHHRQHPPGVLDLALFPSFNIDFITYLFGFTFKIEL